MKTRLANVNTDLSKIHNSIKSILLNDENPNNKSIDLEIVDTSIISPLKNLFGTFREKNRVLVKENYDLKNHLKKLEITVEDLKQENVKLQKELDNLLAICVRKPCVRMM